MNRAEELSAYIELLVYRMKVFEQINCDVVTLQEMQVISFLFSRGSVKMTDIAEYLLFGLSNLTAIVDKLEAKNIVKRVRSDEDRRVVLVSLTSEGKVLAQKNLEQKLDLAKQMLSALSSSDQESLMELMKKIVAQLRSDKHK
jgi:DNA-binding MarR family transcriptional regulator